jgi:hypothetical protein
MSKKQTELNLPLILFAFGYDKHHNPRTGLRLRGDAPGIVQSLTVPPNPSFF